MAVTLRKIGITYRQCAIGSRVAMIMTRLGVEENNFESFMSDVYHRCNDLGLTPQLIVPTFQISLNFRSVPFSQIPNYISQKNRRKKESGAGNRKARGSTRNVAKNKNQRLSLVLTEHARGLQS
jgi:hypothetical protein